MSALVILLLAALWAAILLPGALRARRQHHPVASADGFARAMRTLATRQRPASLLPLPGRSALPVRLRAATRLARAHARALSLPPATPAARRRRAILTGLVGLLAATTVIGAVAGGAAWTLPALSGTVLVAYLGLLAAFLSGRLGGRRRFPTASTAAASAARAAAVRAAVTRPPAGPLGEPAGPGAVVHGAVGSGALGRDGTSGAHAAVAPPTHNPSLPRVTEVPGNAGLVSIRTVPRAGD